MQGWVIGLSDRVHAEPIATRSLSMPNVKQASTLIAEPLHFVYVYVYVCLCANTLSSIPRVVSRTTPVHSQS